MRAERTFDRLDAEAQAALPVVFRELVEVDERGIATRHRAALDRVSHDGQDVAALKLVNALTDDRLLVQSRGEGDLPVVEVAHETLLRSWPRLAAWIEHTHDDLRLLGGLRLAAEQWEQSGRNASFRWPHERLVLVY